MQNIIISVREALSPRYDQREARAITDLLLEEVCGLSRTERILHPDHVLPADQKAAVLACLDQLRTGVPIQQALGYERFCGRRFRVTPDVLIPRPETAELISLIESKHKAVTPPSRLLDIGTGSGCIAISLAGLFPTAQVLAIDLSTAALRVARQNAVDNSVDNVEFLQYDILTGVDNFASEIVNQGLSTTYQPFDVIVSNPPYICRREAAEMSPLVLEHEPDLALFVPDDDPLLFYRFIGCFARKHLNPGGYLFFEINAAYGPETCQLLRQQGFLQVQLHQDINGRDRMVCGINPKNQTYGTF